MNERASRGTSTIQRAAMTGLVAGAVVIIGLKLLTGMAFTPILIVFLLVFAIAGILRLRIDRMTRPGS